MAGKGVDVQGADTSKTQAPSGLLKEPLIAPLGPPRTSPKGRGLEENLGRLDLEVLGWFEDLQVNFGREWAGRGGSGSNFLGDLQGSSEWTSTLAEMVGGVADEEDEVKPGNWARIGRANPNDEVTHKIYRGWPVLLLHTGRCLLGVMAVIFRSSGRNLQNILREPQLAGKTFRWVGFPLSVEFACFHGCLSFTSVDHTSRTH